MSSELTDAQLRERFIRRVIPYIDAQRPEPDSATTRPPVLVYTAGQPGAGKSRANERAAHERSRLVPVIGDDLRRFHPDYNRLMSESPLEMPNVTAKASGAWVAMAASYLREHGHDVMIETTLRSKDAMAATITAFRESGYVVELRVLAVPHEVSRLSTIARYTGQVERSGAGRWTPSAAHDEAFNKAPETIRSLIAAGAVDRLVIEARDGKTLADISFFAMNNRELEISGNSGARLLRYFRDSARMKPAAARRWIADAGRQAEAVVRLGESDPDLLRTMKRVLEVDAQVMQRRAGQSHRRASADPNTGPIVTGNDPHTPRGLRAR